MNKRKLEALAEAASKYSGYHDPTNPLYWARNPGALKAYGVHPADEQHNRVFNSFLDGYQALLYDIRLKVSGQSRAHLQAHQTLTDLVTCYDLPATTAPAWAKFLRQALRNDNLSAKTALQYFLEDE